MSIFEDLIKRGGIVQNKNHLKLFKNIPFSMYPARAFAITLNEINKKKGIKYIKELGRIMGESSANSFKKELSKMGSIIKKDYQTIPNLIQISGFGEIKTFEENKKEITIRIKNHPVITPASELYKNKTFVCEFYAEIYSSYIKIFKNINKINIKHSKCICKKDDICEWILTWD